MRIGMIFLVGLVTSVSACQSKKKETTSSSPGQWPQQMRKMADSVHDLIPYVYDKNAFHDKDNQNKIQKKIDKLAKVSHSVPQKQGTDLFGDDPLLIFNLSNLRDDLKRASETFRVNHTEYSRTVLRGAISHCFKCHSRTNEGPEYHYLSGFPKGLKMDTLEKSDYLVATRQYDDAIELLSGYLKRPHRFTENPYVNSRALRKYVALMVRVKGDPNKTLQVLTQYKEIKKLPYFMNSSLRSWQNSLREWQREKPNKRTRLAESRRLVKKARRLQEEVALDAGYVDYLRASYLLHEELKVSAQAQQRATIYQLLGSAYENLGELGFWSLPENYFENCIRSHPKSRLAKSCFKDFEKNIILGYAGSRGIYLPEDEKKRIKDVKELAGF